MQQESVLRSPWRDSHQLQLTRRRGVPALTQALISLEASHKVEARNMVQLTDPAVYKVKRMKLSDLLSFALAAWVCLNCIVFSNIRSAIVLSFFICLSVDMIVHLYFQEGIFQIGEPYLYASISASHVLKVQFSDPSRVGCVPIQRLCATERKTFAVCRLQVQADADYAG